MLGLKGLRCERTAQKMAYAIDQRAVMLTQRCLGFCEYVNTLVERMAVPCSGPATGESHRVQRAPRSAGWSVRRRGPAAHSTAPQASSRPQRQGTAGILEHAAHPAAVRAQTPDWASSSQTVARAPGRSDSSLASNRVTMRPTSRSLAISSSACGAQGLQRRGLVLQVRSMAVPVTHHRALRVARDVAARGTGHMVTILCCSAALAPPPWFPIGATARAA